MLAGSPPLTRTAQEPAEYPHVQTQLEPIYPGTTQVRGTDPVLTSVQRNLILIRSVFLSHPQLHLTQHGLQSCNVTGQIRTLFHLQGEPRHLDQKYPCSHTHRAIDTSCRDKRAVRRQFGELPVVFGLKEPCRSNKRLRNSFVTLCLTKCKCVSLKRHRTKNKTDTSLFHIAWHKV